MIERVATLMREVASEAIVPRFRKLASQDVWEKSPGELVTPADEHAERLLVAGLAGVLPGAAMVSEEEASRRPALLDSVNDPGPVWLVDPLDGTRNFSEGRAPFAVMIALLRGGEMAASWMLDPLTGRLAVAELGAGAFVDGARVRTSSQAVPLGELRGAVFTRLMPAEVRATVEPRRALIGEALPGLNCAGAEYPAIVAGEEHFALFWRTLPWDHAPGVLFALEAGAAARRPDGTAYRPGDGRSGLLIAHNEAIWHEAAGVLFGATPSMRP